MLRGRSLSTFHPAAAESDRDGVFARCDDVHDDVAAEGEVGAPAGDAQNGAGRAGRVAVPVRLSSRVPELRRLWEMEKKQRRYLICCVWYE